VAVLGRLLISSAERLDLPDVLSIDSYNAGDWKYFLKGFVGDTKPFILKGFDIIDPQTAIGTQSCSIKIADSVVFYPGSQAGAFYHGLAEGNVNAQPLVPELRKNAVNYVYLTFSTSNTSVDTRAFWDPDKDVGAGGEFAQDVNTESVLTVTVNVSTGSFPDNTIPVAIVTVGPVVITAIEDARDLLFRLGSGGISPNPYNKFDFPALPSSSFERAEPSTIMVSPSDPNPFQGADKNISNMKDWMDAVMTKLNELGGTRFWYEDTSSYGIITTFIDALATTLKSKGTWAHDATVPGLLTWTEDLNLKYTQDPRDYIIRNGSVNLNDDQVAYLALSRNLQINSADEAVSWTNGQSYVNTVGGSVGLFANLAKGDWIKKINDTNDKWLRVEEFYDTTNLGGSTTTAGNAKSIRLSAVYQGVTAVEKGRHDKGVYQPSDIVVSSRSASAMQTVGGNFHWIGLRSDTIEGIGNIASTTVSGTITTADGVHASVSATGHGLVTNDRITVTAPAGQAGTYVVEVEDANTFTFQTAVTTTGSFTGRYAVVTTAARSTTWGLQLESANHRFKSSDTVIIGGTTGYNGSYLINVRGLTSFSVPIAASHSTETTGTATLAKIEVKSEGGTVQIIQGEVVSIGDEFVDNLRQFLGMDSLSETYPLYGTPSGYNTLQGAENFNALSNDNVTARLSKLSSMMADRAQDKTVQCLPLGVTEVVSTTNGSAQEITFLGAGSTLTLTQPGSPGNAIVSLPSTSPGISLLVNQVAYVKVNRNAATTPSIVVANIATLTVDENMFVIAARLAGPTVWLWDGTSYSAGSAPYGQYGVNQDRNLKVIEGGTWSWNLSTQTLNWSAPAYVQIPGFASTANTIAGPSSVVLTAGQVAYVELNRHSPGGTIAVSVTDIASLAMTSNTLIIARRGTNSVLVGAHSMRLNDGESKFIDGGISDQNLTFIGATASGDSAPNYAATSSGSLNSPNYNTTSNESLTSRIAKLTAMLADIKQDINIDLDPGIITWDGTNITVTSALLSVPGTTVGSAAVTINNLSSTALPANSCLYVDINRATSTALTLASSTLASLTPSQQRLVLIRNIGGNLLVT
jgi:hypothetical protein